MRAVVQRVSRAQVRVAGQVITSIDRGLLVLLAVGIEDNESGADYLAKKVLGVRIFEDAEGRMNREIGEVGGAILAVSQFTLYGDVRHGKRPSFIEAAPPERARQLYDRFVEQIRIAGVRCETGRFRTTMEVELVNNGPVTILIDSQKNF
jgi:D-aminoacyl-tRNA deacylase